MHGFFIVPKFEVLGTPASLLNVSLPASATLFTRRGTLVGINGSINNVTSTFSMLKPTLRALTGIPFLYQKISSTTPVTALVSSKSGSVQTTFSVVSLDGRLDWTVAQRGALLAWTGSTLTLKAKLVPSLSLARWGNTVLSGRGEVALVGKGQIYQITLREPEEQFLVHPSNVLAYTSSLPAAVPVFQRVKHTRVNFSVPTWLGGNLFKKSDSPIASLATSVSENEVYRFLSRAWFQVKSGIRRFIWGNDMFIRFQGPCTILIQSRATRLADLISAREVRQAYEAAAVQPESFAEPLSNISTNSNSEAAEAKVEAIRKGNASKGGHMKVATVSEGKVEFKSVDSFDEFVKK
ncbi:mitochondrial biogenesis AIM24-domain-containing protein [Lipomyces oligophaga]|uniref:mitochondrial biogenesis AIM24-domain-containing protein n=1 Tax=Lipomyces oligophaga TaxID=45792 RepID=UPI0034CD8158